LSYKGNACKTLKEGNRKGRRSEKKEMKMETKWERGEVEKDEQTKNVKSRGIGSNTGVT
jgi:hypothetical protein